LSNERPLNQTDPFQIAGYCVEPSRLRVTGDGTEVRLEAKTMLVLVYLFEHAGRVVSRAELERELWPGRIVTEDSVTSAVAKLRRIFSDDAHSPRVIETVPKSGYRLIAEVGPIESTDRESGACSVPTSSAQRYAWRPRIPRMAGIIAVPMLLIAFWWVLDRAKPGPGWTGPSSDRPAVAVLPFENLGVAPEQDYFAKGITSDLITDLSKLEGLLVIAPGSAFAYKASTTRPRQISVELDVDYVVVGSVQREATTLRINVQLIEARVDRALWGERYTGLMTDVFDIQDKLAAEVIAALKVELAPGERASLAIRPTASVAAYDHYLRGLEDHGSRTEAQNVSARGHFGRAIALDPGFARAYAGLALTHSRDAIDGWTATPAHSLELAAQLADKAARMDPLLPQVHFVTGQVDLFRRQHEKAIEAAQRAIGVDPNYADAYALLAWTLNYAGRPGKALSALQKAMRLNPRPPASYLEILGEIEFVQGRYGESASTFHRVLDINPGYTRARMWNAAALARADARDAAEWEVAELLVANPDAALTRLELAFPFKDPRALETLFDALRSAGLPEG
jgi:TolB-like protein/DNA-binding winged helix-turn-helix (wHTH) protein/Flp pilus assembly protein TadD